VRAQKKCVFLLFFYVYALTIYRLEQQWYLIRLHVVSTSILSPFFPGQFLVANPGNP